MEIGDTVRVRRGVYKGRMAVIRRVHDVMVTIAIADLGDRRVNQSSCERQSGVRCVPPREGRTKCVPEGRRGDTPADGDGCLPDRARPGRVMPIALLIELLDALVIERDASDSVPYAEWTSIRDRVDALYADGK